MPRTGASTSMPTSILCVCFFFRSQCYMNTQDMSGYICACPCPVRSFTLPLSISCECSGRERAHLCLPLSCVLIYHSPLNLMQVLALVLSVSTFNIICMSGTWVNTYVLVSQMVTLYHPFSSVDWLLYILSMFKYMYSWSTIYTLVLLLCLCEMWNYACAKCETKILKTSTGPEIKYCILELSHP